MNVISFCFTLSKYLIIGKTQFLIPMACFLMNRNDPYPRFYSLAYLS